MARPKRSASDLSDFEDPLKNYEKPSYADALERSLSEDPVTVMETTPFRTITPDTKIEKAMRMMVEDDLACLMVEDRGRLVGIFSERDVLNRIAEDFEAIKHGPIRVVMTRDPVYIHDTDSPAVALNLMAVGGFRHIPILDVDDRIVGILGPIRVVRYLQRFLED
ncbi:MAG: CBS domain-containing protein [Planctomycetes bacterium]|nr:CBS domain-containing protein [Planctomycetota bacterium]